MKRKERASCDTCAFYVYDDEYGAYLCDMNMDEDDYVRINTRLSENKCRVR